MMIPWEQGINDFAEKILASATSNPKRGNPGSYYEIPISYDSEWSSFYDYADDEHPKRATLYIWMLGCGPPDDAIVLFGRRTSEFLECINMLVDLANLSERKKIIIYVHYLGADFQFFRRWFEWDKAFYDDSRGVYYARYHGVEFRCELKLAGGRSLDECGKNLRHYHVRKLVGSLDYSLSRHSSTPLTNEELDYCEHDVLVSLAYISEKIQDDGGIASIPLTNTGYVRKFIRDSVLTSKNYQTTIRSLTLDASLYDTAKSVFRGGDTHANPYFVNYGLANNFIPNVFSFDLTSAYPGAMVLRKFPMTTPELDPHVCSYLDLDYLASQPSKYFIARIELYNLTPILNHTHPLSFSKTLPKNNVNCTLDNGRIVETEYCSTYVTELDYLILRRYYSFKSLTVDFCYVGQKGYLPTPFVKSILSLYHDKTALKKVSGKEREYMIAKNMINASFGMSVTDPVKDEVVLDNTDEEQPFHAIHPDISSELEKLNNSRNRFLYYLWGVYTTAWCRHELYNALDELAEDFVYCDTDSVKGINLSVHSAFIERENANIMALINKSSEYHRLPKSLYCPKAPNGKEYPIGLWDYEGTYSRFKTLGSKRYLVEKDGRYQLTVSGLRKSAVTWLMKDDHITPYPDASILAQHVDDDKFWEPFDGFREDPFPKLDWGITIPAGISGRTIHSYIDNEISGTLTDYLGNTEEYYEKSALFVENSEFTMDSVEDFVRFLKLIPVKELIT